MIEAWTPEPELTKDGSGTTAMTIRVNEIIDVQDSETYDTWRSDTWWFGTKVGTTESGWFPAACTKIIQWQMPAEEEENQTKPGSNPETTVVEDVETENVQTYFDESHQPSATTDSHGNVDDGTGTVVNVNGESHDTHSLGHASDHPIGMVTMRAVEAYVGPGTVAAADGQVDPEATMADVFRVTIGDILLVDRQRTRSAALTDDFSDVVFCRNLTSGESGWVPFAKLRAIRPGSTKSASSDNVFNESQTVNNARVVAPDWVLQHSSASHTDRKVTEANATSWQKSPNTAATVSEEVSLSSSSCSSAPPPPPASDVSQQQTKHRMKPGRPKPINIASVDDAAEAETLTSSDGEVEDDSPPTQRSTQLLSPSSEISSDNDSSSCDDDDELLRAFRAGETPHVSPVVEPSAVVLRSRSTTSPSLGKPHNRTPPRPPSASSTGSLDRTLSDSFLSLGPRSANSHHHINRFRHQPIGRSKIETNTTRRSSKSVPSSPELRALKVTPATLNSPPAWVVAEPPAPHSLVALDVSRRNSSNTSSTMAALLSPPRSRQRANQLPAISPANHHSRPFELTPSSFVNDSRNNKNNNNKKTRSKVSSFRSSPSTDRGQQNGGSHDDDTSYAWLLQQQEIARAHGTQVARDTQQSQRILGEFLQHTAAEKKNASLSPQHRNPRPGPQSHARAISSVRPPPTQIQSHTPSSSSATTNPTPAAVDGKADRAKGMECIICCDNTIDTALYPCWHIICCASCAARVTKCPQCRKKIKFRQKVFIK